MKMNMFIFNIVRCGFLVNIKRESIVLFGKCDYNRNKFYDETENAMGGQAIQKKSDRTRQRIFEAAMAIMGEKGYQGVTVRDTCQRAEVSIGSFYR